MTKHSTLPNRRSLLSIFKNSSGCGTMARQRPLFVESLEQRQLLAVVGPGAEVATDLPDYTPGSTATIFASNYEVGETIEFQVLHVDGTPNTGDGHDPWQVTDGSKMDLDGLLDGNVTTRWLVAPDDSMNSTFELTAAGLDSGLIASSAFTDGPIGNHVKSFNVWEPTTNSWIGGNADGYAEGDTADFRVEVDLAESEADLITGGANEEVFVVDVLLDLDADSGGAYGFTSLDYVTGDGVTIVDVVPNGEVGDYLSYTVSFTIDSTDTSYINFGGVLAEPGAEFVTSYDADGNPLTTGTVPEGMGASAVGGVFQARVGSQGSGDKTVNFKGADIAPPPSIAVEKYTNGADADTPTGPLVPVGDTVTWTYEVTNTGEDPIYNVAVIDDQGVTITPVDVAPADGIIDGDTNADGLLDTTETWVYQATGTAIEGQYANLATATGESRTGKTTTATDPSHYFGTSPSLTISKEGDVETVDAAGDVINYTIVVDNTGNQTLTGIALTDLLPDKSEGTVSGPTGDLDGDSELDIDETWTYTISYTVTQDDIDAGLALVNIATVDTNETDPASDNDVVIVDQNPALTISKEGDVETVDAVGDVINYTIVVDNTGNQTLTGIALTDLLPDNSEGTVSGPTGDLDGDSELDIDETWTYTISYTVTQDDIDAGLALVNNATVDTNETDSASDNDVVIVDQNPALTISKEGDVETVDAAGDVINYTIVVDNVGNQSLTNVGLTDQLPDGSTGTVSGPTGDTDGDSELDIDETWTYTISYTVTQAEIDAGLALVNDATVTTNETEPATDDDVVNVDQNPALTISKEGDVPTVDAAGDVINYTIVVDNVGNQTLTGVSLTDELPDGSTGTVSGPTGDDDGDNKLDIDETWTYTISYTVTQADIDDGGTLVNVATVTTNETESATDNDVVTVDQNPALTISKEGDVPTVDAAGDVINYTIVVDNVGNQTLTGVSLTDELPDGSTGTVSGPTGDADGDNKLDIDETWTYTISYTVTQADIDDGGTLVNVATVTTNETEIATDDDVVTVDQNPALTISKDSDVTTVDTAGEVIHYTIVVDNAGNQTLTGVSLTDKLPDGSTGTVSGPTGDADGDNELDIDETWTYTISYTVTQAEIDAGIALVNDAAVDTNETEPINDDAVVSIGQNPAMTVEKTANVATVDEAGDVIDYTIVVDNTGNQSLTGIVISDELPNGATGIVSGPAGDVDADNELDIDETWSYTISYTVTQSDIDAGVSLVNVAIVDSNETEPVDDDAVVNVNENPALTIEKTADVATVDEAGDVIHYTIVVVNTGNQTLTGVDLTDVLPDGSPGSVAGPSGDADSDGKLDIDETWTYTINYVVTQADIDAGGLLTNVATVDTDQIEPVDDDAVVNINQNPALTIDKTADVATVDAVGDLINYTIIVENTGNQTLTGVVLTDVLPDGPGTVSGPAGDTDSDGKLDIDETWTYTISYTVTQADLDAVTPLVNVATVNTNETEPAEDDAWVTIDDNPAIFIDKSSTLAIDADNNGEVSLGDTVLYTYTVKNTGNVTLTGVTVDDTPLGPVTLSDSGSDGIDVIAPGVIEVGTLTHVVTQADVDAGAIFNEVVADSDESDPEIDDETVPIPQHPAIVVDKTSILSIDADGNGEVSLGDTIEYTYTVTNTGNVTLTGVTVVDTPLGPVTLSDLGNDGVPILAPEAVETGTLTHVVVQADVEAGLIVNDVIADSNESDPNTDNETVPVPQHPAILVDKTSVLAIDADGNGETSLGDTIEYTYTVTNTGNLILNGVTVVDTPLGPVTLSDLGNDGVPVLAPGAIESGTLTYVVTQADVEAGQIVNDVVVDSDESDPDTDQEIVPIAQYPELTITKTADVVLVDEAGDVITYTFVVENTGNMILTDVIVVDPMLTNMNVPTPIVGDADNDGDVDLLNPTNTVAFTATYVVTQADMDSGIIPNTATTIGSPLVGPDVTDEDTEVVEALQLPSIELVKTYDSYMDRDSDGTISVGDMLIYQFAVRNDGNVTLTEVTIQDPLTGLNINVGTLAPGAKETVLSSYYVTQADLDAGEVLNTALATGTDPNDDPTTDDDEETVIMPQFPAIDVEKATNGVDADTPTGPAVAIGDTVLWTYEVTNPGNVSLGNVTLVDDNGTPGVPGDDFNPTFIGGDIDADGLLDVNETWLFDASGIAENGQYVNSATVAAFGPQQQPVDDTDLSHYFGKREVIIIGADKGTDSQPYVMVIDEITGEVLSKFLAYEADYRGGVRIAVGDMTGDGIDEIITSAGRTHTSEIKVFTQDGVELTPFRTMAYDPSFTGGSQVAVGDVNGDGKLDIVTVPTDSGPAEVRVFLNQFDPLDPTADAIADTPYRSFLAFDENFIGGAVVEAVDMGTFANGQTIDPLALDGKAEIIVGNGPGMRSVVNVYDASPASPTVVRSFAPFSDSFRGGVSIDLDRVTNDLIPDLIVGSGNSGASNVEVWDGRLATKISDFDAYTGSSRNAPVRVAGLDTDGDGIVEEIVTVQGTDGQTREIRRFDALTGTLLETIPETDPDFYGEYFVDTASANPILYSNIGPKTISLTGTSGDDVFTVVPGILPNAWIAVLNGQRYDFAAESLTLTFDGLGGNDEVSITGTAGDDVANLLPDGGQLVGENYSISALNSEMTTMIGGGGKNTASLNDSPGNDKFDTTPTSATLTGLGFSETALDFDTVHGYARAGGYDVASLTDSPEDDQFVGNHSWAKLFNDNFFTRAKFFDSMHTYARAGGNDTARMYDSSGNDEFIGRQDWSRMIAEDGTSSRVKFFDSVKAFASTGQDKARMYGSSGSDNFFGYSNIATLSGPGYENCVSKFDSVLASVAGSGTGRDTASLYDSAGNDIFTATPNRTNLTGPGFTLKADFFDYVHSYAKNGGHDVANMYGSTGDDIFVGKSSFSILRGDGFNNRAKFFEEVHAWADEGGSDRALLYGTDQDDVLHASDDRVEMSSNGAVDYLYEVFAFESVKAMGSTGANTANVDSDVDFLTLSGF